MGWEPHTHIVTGNLVFFLELNSQILVLLAVIRVDINVKA